MPRLTNGFPRPKLPVCVGYPARRSLISSNATAWRHLRLPVVFSCAGRTLKSSFLTVPGGGRSEGPPAHVEVDANRGAETGDDA